MCYCTVKLSVREYKTYPKIIYIYIYIYGGSGTRNNVVRFRTALISRVNWPGYARYA
jgi:hypothetical protein